MHEKRVQSDEARRNLRSLLDSVEHRGEHVTVLRYNIPAAVIVPVAWYEQARKALSREEGGA